MHILHKDLVLRNYERKLVRASRKAIFSHVDNKCAYISICDSQSSDNSQYGTVLDGESVY